MFAVCSTEALQSSQSRSLSQKVRERARRFFFPLKINMCRKGLIKNVFLLQPTQDSASHFPVHLQSQKLPDAAPQG